LIEVYYSGEISSYKNVKKVNLYSALLCLDLYTCYMGWCQTGFIARNLLIILHIYIVGLVIWQCDK